MQTYPALECILVVDYNLGLLERCRSIFTRVNVLENSERRGLAGARNSEILKCSGDVIAFLDDDAFADPRWLEELILPYSDPLVVGTGGLVSPKWEVKRPSWFPSTFSLGCGLQLPRATD